MADKIKRKKSFSDIRCPRKSHKCTLFFAFAHVRIHLEVFVNAQLSHQQQLAHV